jgi:PAS domain S-box-containing protein
MNRFKFFHFQKPTDEIENKRISYFTNATLLVTISLSSILSVIRIILPRNTNLSDYILWTVTGILLIIYLVFKKGKVNLAGLLFVFTCWLTMTVLAWTYEGVRDIAIVAYIISILIAMLITKPWQALTISFLSIISLWVIFYAERNQIIIPKTDTSFNYSIEFTAILIIVIALMYLTSKSFSASYGRVQKELEERKRAEEALNRSEEKYREIIEQIRDVVFLLSPQGLIVSFNWTFENITGWQMHEWIGKPFIDLLHPEDVPLATERFSNVLKGQLSQAAKYRIRKKSGDYVFAEILASGQMKEGKITGILGIARDITDRTKAEEKLRMSEEKFSRLFHSSPDAILLTELKNGKIIEVNKSFEKFSGFSGEELIGHPVLEFNMYSPTERQRFVSILQEKGNVHDVEFVLKNKAGQELHVLSSAEIIEIEGKPHILTILKDISERKRAEEALIQAKEKAEESDSLKTAFMNNISHEVRTPLNGIMGFAQFVLQPNITGEEKVYYLDVLNTSCERLLNTITDYMDISLIVSGNMQERKQPVLLSRLLNEIYDKFQAKCRAKKLEFIKQIPSDTNDYTLHCDATLLEKSISHLVDNAIKFTQTGSVILGFCPGDNKCELFVKDTGSGINPELLEKIFDYFRQGEVSSTRGYEGSGLGLSIAQGLVKLLGGKISVESVKGKGSTFIIALPAEIEIKSSVDFSNARKNHPASKISILVLIADDDEISIFFHKTILEKASFKYLIARNGLEAIEKCRENQGISIILMDLKMPVMEGLEATRKIREFRPNLPIIGVSAYAMAGDKEKAIAAGCDDYITKPVQSDLLLSVINKYL